MNTEKTLEIDSLSFARTLELGCAVGSNLRGGEVLELVGDLGAGKTAFVRGLAKGAGTTDEVSSPSFTISNEYRTTTGLRINHFDFYRLGEAGVVSEELKEVLAQPQEVVVVEWGDIVHDVLPPSTIRIKIEHRGGDKRHYWFVYPRQFNYLFEGIEDSK